jgi:hypothetical protein
MQDVTVGTAFLDAVSLQRLILYLQDGNKPFFYFFHGSPAMTVGIWWVKVPLVYSQAYPHKA